MTMEHPQVYSYQLTALAPWAWHGLAVPSGTATLNDIVTDTAMAFAVASALGMVHCVPCLPSVPEYRRHLAVLPFKTALFWGHGNRLNRPLACRLNLDAECGLPERDNQARKSGNVKDFYHIQEVAVGSVFHGHFLYADPLRIAQKVSGFTPQQLVVRLGLGRRGVGLLERTADAGPVRLNLHTARLFDPDIRLEASEYLLYNIQPSHMLEPEEALRVTASWFHEKHT